MKRIVFVLLLIMPLSVMAQNITGKVIMAGDKTPAQFAGVGLLQLPDSAAVAGVIYCRRKECETGSRSE
jgi:hypothetical protein